MTTIKIKLDTIEKVRNFVNTVTALSAKYNINLDLQSGRYCVDARSLMGIFSLDLVNFIDLIIYSEDEKIVNEVKKEINKWIL